MFPCAQQLLAMTVFVNRCPVGGVISVFSWGCLLVLQHLPVRASGTAAIDRSSFYCPRGLGQGEQLFDFMSVVQL
jgi:hypothetical protein